MSFTTGTTNYNLPHYIGTDTPSWTDTNEGFAAIDSAVYGAVGNVSGLSTRMTTAEGNITQLQTDVTTAQTTANTATSGVATNATAITGLDTRVTTLESHEDNKFNSIAVADAYNVATSYNIGDIVTYNGNRYVCTTATTGEPWDADHWSAEDVQTALNSKIKALAPIASVTADGVKTYSEIYADLYNATEPLEKIQDVVFLTDDTGFFFTKGCFA